MRTNPSAEQSTSSQKRGDGSVKEGRRGGGDDTVDTKGIDSGLASFYRSRKICLPDVTTGYETEGEDKGGRFNAAMVGSS